MGYTPKVVILVLGWSAVFAVTVADQKSSQLLPEQDNTTQDSLRSAPANEGSRKGRHVHVDVIHLPSLESKAKRQVIKVPSDVSKVKLIRPALNLRSNRAPQMFKKQFSYFRGGNERIGHKKQHVDNFDSNQDDYDLYDLKKVKRNLKKFKSKENVPQEFIFQDEMMKPKNEQPVLKPKKKNANSLLGDYFVHNCEMEGRKERTKEKENHFNGYEASAASIHLKQVPAPNLFKTVGPPEMMKQSQVLYDQNYIPGLSIKKLPTKGRQMQSIFSQQYTSHNPHVATNFGIPGFGTNGLQFVAKDTVSYGFPVSLGKFSHPLVAASDQMATSVPAFSPGIQVIQPPQFRDVTVSHPSHPSRLVSSLQPQPEETSSQRATIRDILDQDCPAHESKGYCESPPRYPMQQISNMVKKCGNFMEMMNTQPFEEPHDVFTFARRSDVDAFENNSSAVDNHSWSRSSREEATACSSDITLTEPGYAREIMSGRWFVIVQHPDTTIQRISTDTCRNPGQPCAGVNALKCSKNSKATTCVQRYTYQRLISWDPEAPEGCPRIRLFRFPSACVCHLALG